MTEKYSLNPIGEVESSYTDLKQCPSQPGRSCPSARIRIYPEYTRALHRLEPGQEIVLITFLNQADRDTLQCRPRNNPRNPVHGVFATRSPNRPNPLGLHQVRILSVEKESILVHPLEVLNKTPVVDIKPVLGSRNRPSQLSGHFSGNDTERLVSAADQACRKNLINGFNGNLSLRNEEHMLITGSGVAKAFLKNQDLCVLKLETGEKVEGRCRASSEAGMHLEIYRQQPRARAIVHTHPTALLSLTRARGDLALNGMDLFEADLLLNELAVVPGFRPGSADLAQAVGRAASKARAVFMSGHGLTCWGDSPEEALALNEEMEALAAVRLNQLLLQACT